MTGMGRQLHDNLVAITSLFIALSALGYNTWRNERTERNRNIRVAGIEMLREIGSLQQVIFHARFTDDSKRGDPSDELRMGWVDVNTINDLAAVMPSAVVEEANQLRIVWEAESGGVVEQYESFQRIDAAIEELRQATLVSLRALK